ncbi:MAG TPA: type 2 isopentenyl-diphosphate Delta-isomerase [Dehalococcoidia bacterium]|nr:type 2 isopentenyl-diphosphate Delta-isomerase [Dehalococcoidia bacterium]
MTDPPISQRKLDHLRVSLEEDVQSREIGAGFERFTFVHNALPEMDLGEVNLSVEALGKRLRAPLLISSMTGGTELAWGINRNLALAAQSLGIGLALGSERAAIEHPSLAYTYRVREVAPDILLLANLGAVQLNNGFGLQECLQAVQNMEADGLILHLNPLQECLQEGGNTNFKGLLGKIASLAGNLPVPVLVKEVGWGVSFSVAQRLVQAGVRGIETAGAGGTSWSEVEKHLAKGEARRTIAEDFAPWGIPTTQSILACRRAAPEILIIGSGGIRTGVEAAKAIALGADLIGMGRPLLRPATVSSTAVEERVERTLEELRIAMFCVGAADLAQLKKAELHGPAEAI